MENAIHVDRKVTDQKTTVATHVFNAFVLNSGWFCHCWCRLMLVLLLLVRTDVGSVTASMDWCWFCYCWCGLILVLLLLLRADVGSGTAGAD